MLLSLSRCLAFSLVIAGAAAAQDRLTPELLWGLARVAEPQPSPDGKRVLYAVRTYDVTANKGTSQLFVLDVAAGTARQLTHAGSNSGGCWSPDGAEIAFVSTRGGSAQIWRMPIDGGEPRQVTDHEGGVSNIAWSPTGKHLSFTADVKLDPQVRDMFPDLPKAEARVFDDLMIRHWDTWREGTYSHLFVVPADGGAAIDLMAGQRVDTPLRPFGAGEQLAWSPDGAELCYTAKAPMDDPESSTDSGLYAVAIGRPGEHRLLTPNMGGYDVEPRYSPDGKHIAFLSMARAGFEADKNRLMLLERGSGRITELTAGFDQSAHEPVWLDDRTLAFTSDVAGTTQVYRVGLDGSAPAPVSQGRWQFASIAPARGGEALFALRQCTERPFELVQLSAAVTSEGRALTDVNGKAFAKLRLPTVRERRITATDGASIHAWVVYPPDFDPAKKHPMLLYCQGGPQQQVGQWFSFRWNFHLMAAQGYIVLAVNRRGLPGFGQQWNDDISRDWGGQAMRDLLSATDDMLAEPYVDAARVAAVGASFGGYTVYWLMGNGGDRFAAMIAHCGVFNLESMYGSTEELFFVNWDLGGPYWSSPDVKRDYDRFSPHRFVQNWKTPLLVIHGEKDFRVPVAEGIQAFTAARVNGVPARFLYFPEEGHWVMSPQNGLLWQRVFFDWLERWCGGKGQQPARK
jgi:dipeptidyl aminopeptidase/acylaminoacyl peptidase